MKIEMRLNWFFIPLITIGVMLFSRCLMMNHWQWYFTLKMPPITPSALIIRGIWQLIYVCTTGSVLIIYNLGERTKRFWYIMALFCVTTGLNLYWIYLFFNQHILGWAIICAATLAALLWLLVVTLWPV